MISKGYCWRIQNCLMVVSQICMGVFMCRVVAYYRVSTASQGRSGLGLEGQREAVAALCRVRGWEIIAEFTEVESGKRNDRLQLAAALNHAEVRSAKLVVAKLDRLSRDAEFTLKLRNSQVDFTCADNPDVNRLTIGILAVINEDERERISERTKAALRAAKARGAKLGNPNSNAPLLRAGKGNTAAVMRVRENAVLRADKYASAIAMVRAKGVTSLAGIADALNAEAVKTPRGRKWHPSSVRNLLARIDGGSA
jgi:DNA invertase Pin-like site-specific DNA recombinase